MSSDMTDDYTPQPGECVVHEQTVTDWTGAERLERVRVSFHVRLSHAEAKTLQQRYPGTYITSCIDSFGEGAEVTCQLRLTDIDVRPYLMWRDTLLARIYQASQDITDVSGG